MKTLVTCLLVAMLCVVSIDASAEMVFKVIARLLEEQEQAARKRDASANLEKVRAVREVLTEKLEEMFPVVENYISAVQKKFGVRELNEEMIEMGLRSACAMGSLEVGVQAGFLTRDQFQPLCEAMDMPWMIHSDDL